MFNDILIVEGVEEASDDEQLAAWQRLVNNGVIWSLQGSFGRMALQLIEAGLISPPAGE